MSRILRILINKSEITAGTRGASLGPEAIMTAARKQKNQLFGNFPVEYIPDRNDVLDNEIKFPEAKRILGLFEVFQNVSSRVGSTLRNNEFPLVLAGDHGSAGGTIAGIKAAFPDKRLGVVWIDAHGDLHTPYTTPSGNMHGMPLATALGIDNTEEKVNDLSDQVITYWENLKNTGIKGSKIAPEDLVFIGVRDTEKQEDAIISRYNIVNHTVSEVRAKGCEKVFNEIVNQLSVCDVIYVSFDVDSMDPLYTSHGTGTPVDKGLTPEEAEYFLTHLAELKKTACIEFVEVNPCLDEKINKMAEVTFELLDKTVKALLK